MPAESSYDEGMTKYMKFLLIPLLLFALAACDPNQLGQPAEDDPTWDCLHHGNGICGPVHVDYYGDHICAQSEANGDMGCDWDWVLTPDASMPNAYPGYICARPFKFCTNDITYH